MYCALPRVIISSLPFCPVICCTCCYLGNGFMLSRFVPSFCQADEHSTADDKRKCFIDAADSAILYSVSDVSFSWHASLSYQFPTNAAVSRLPAAVSKCVSQHSCRTATAARHWHYTAGTFKSLNTERC